MKVWRVEDSGGMGPYYGGNKAGGERGQVCREHRDTRPFPRSVAWDLFEQPVSGCKTLHSLRHWFGGYLRALRQLGYRVVRYEVPKKYVEVVGCQLVFDKARARAITKVVKGCKGVRTECNGKKSAGI